MGLAHTFVWEGTKIYLICSFGLLKKNIYMFFFFSSHKETLFIIQPFVSLHIYPTLFPLMAIFFTCIFYITNFCYQYSILEAFIIRSFWEGNLSRRKQEDKN